MRHDDRGSLMDDVAHTHETQVWHVSPVVFANISVCSVCVPSTFPVPCPPRGCRPGHLVSQHSQHIQTEVAAASCWSYQKPMTVRHKDQSGKRFILVVINVKAAGLPITPSQRRHRPVYESSLTLGFIFLYYCSNENFPLSYCFRLNSSSLIQKRSLFQCENNS